MIAISNEHRGPTETRGYIAHMDARWSTPLVLATLMILAGCAGDAGPAAADAGGNGGPQGSDAAPGGGGGDVADAHVGPDAKPLPAPVETWKEHWFEHNQLLTRVDYNDEVALYFDPDVDRKGTEWLMP